MKVRSGGKIKGEKYMSQRVDGDLWGSCIKEIDNKKRI